MRIELDVVQDPEAEALRVRQSRAIRAVLAWIVDHPEPQPGITVLARRVTQTPEASGEADTRRAA